MWNIALDEQNDNNDNNDNNNSDSNDNVYVAQHLSTPGMD